MLNKAIHRMPQIDPSRYFQNLPEGFINMTYGEPIMPVFPHIQEAIEKSTKDQIYTLSPPTGLPALREKIVEKLKRENGINCDIENIMVTNGAHEALGLSCASLLEPGDEVVIFKPDWSIFSSFAKYFNCKAVYVLPQYSKYLAYDLSEFENLITDRTKLVVLNTPQNPSGAVFPEKAIRQIVGLCRKKNVCLIADEVYEKLVFEVPHFSAGAAEETPENVFTLHSFSKGNALSGLRIGYLCAAKSAIKKIANLKTAFSFGTNIVSQHAALAALDTTPEMFHEMLRNYRDKREQLMACFDDKEIAYIIPQGAFFVLADFSHFGIDEVSYRKLVEQTGILTFPGSFFGTDNKYLRFSFSGTDDNVAEAIEALRNKL